jgi:hypothetical protein
MNEILYHVFFEDNQDGVGLYIGSYKEKERAEKIGYYVWNLFENDGTDKSAEIIEAIKLWRKYEISEITQFTLFSVRGILRSSGLASILVFESGMPDFVEKYIEYRGTLQPELFPKEEYEDCIMYQHKEKRLLAQKKAARRGKDIQGLKNQILVNGFSEKMQKERFEITGLDRLLWKEIEVTQDFYNRVEKCDTITICMTDEAIKSEIIDFEYYFRCDVVLKARIFDEAKNIIYFDLEDIVVQ